MIRSRGERLRALEDELEDESPRPLFWERMRNRDWSEFYIPAAVGVAVMAILLAIFTLTPAYFERHTITTHVVSKENVCKSSGDHGVTCEYLIFTDNGTFKISDALFGLVRFNSSDVYGRIREDKDYTITYYGWRIPAFSTYPNIEKIEPVEG